MIHIASWNIRGLHYPHKQDEVRNLVHSHNISLIGILETHVQESNSLHISSGLLPGWRFKFNYSSHRGGRIWLAWNPNILDVQVLSSSDQLIHSQVTVLETQVTFLNSVIYGKNNVNDRQRLWNSIISIANQNQSLP